MRVLLAAAASLVAAAASGAAASATPVTLYSIASGTISGFAQDGDQIAWFTRRAKGCNAVHVRSLANGLNVELPQQGGARNVTCLWNVGRDPVRLAIAAGTANVLWTLHETAPLEFEYVVGAGADNRLESRFQQLAHTNRGAGLWFGGVTGDGSTLAYGVTSVDYQDEAGCLAGTDTCAMKIVPGGGGVYRVADRQKLKLVPGTTAAVGVAAAANRIAYIEADSIGKQGQPVAGADLPIEVVDATSGRVITSVTPQGTPVAIALSQNVLATLERTPLGLRLAWYSPTTGAAAGSVPVALATSPELAVSDQLAVFHVGRSIRAVEIDTGRVRTLARAAATPIGLSVEGGRAAWAENLEHGSRIRALYVSGRR